MKLIKKIVELQNELFNFRKKGFSVGFVPTMGALHQGHGSLIHRCAEQNDVTIVSVFLNPTQFNDSGDLARYPRTLEADCLLAEQQGADIVFAPSVEEIYPTPDTRQFDFPPITTVMEGAKRPGHFNGVCQVVSRLFYIVRPDKAYFGEKDWQQIAVVKRLVRYIGMDIQIIECPIIREADGLAMSSRNALLKPEERAIAPQIYRALQDSLHFAGAHTLQDTHNEVIQRINSTKGLDVEYFEIVDGNTLLPIDSWTDSDYIVGCITVNCGNTPIRLIDHIKYKPI